MSISGNIRKLRNASVRNIPFLKYKKFPFPKNQKIKNRENRRNFFGAFFFSGKNARNFLQKNLKAEAGNYDKCYNLRARKLQWKNFFKKFSN